VPILTEILRQEHPFVRHTLAAPLAFNLRLSNNKLVLTRNNPRLTLEGARTILAAAEKKAREIAVPMNIAIVDDGGHLLVFARMDGAKLSSVEVALTKAMGAALRRAPTGPAKTGGEPGVILSLGLSLATDGKLTAIRGGLPLVVGGQCVGGIGVSAGSEDEDVQVAQAGVDALAQFS
jgi:glc operon protein GlcG